MLPTFKECDLIRQGNSRASTSTQINNGNIGSSAEMKQEFSQYITLDKPALEKSRPSWHSLAYIDSL